MKLPLNKIQLAIAGAVILLTIFVAGLFYVSLRAPNTNNYGRATTTGQTAPNPFPAPARNQAKFYQIRDAGSIQYSVTPLITNMTNDVIHGGHVLSIDYYNSSRKTITPSGEQLKSLDIGCIAKNDEHGYRTVKDDPSMFSATVSKRPANSGRDLADIESWKHSTVEIEIHPACIYIGTADLQHYWKIK